MTEGFKVTLQPDCIHTDYKDDQMTHQQSEEEQKKQHRRGILKAVAGAPLMFTLPTGAAVAATSLTCNEKSNSLPTPVGATTSPGATDTWIRYKVQRKEIRLLTPNSKNGPTTIVRNAFTLGTDWYRVNNHSSAVTKVINLDSTYPAVDVQNRFYYLLVDHDKYSESASPESFVYLGTAPVLDPVAGTSCWNSVTPGANLTSNILN